MNTPDIMDHPPGHLRPPPPPPSEPPSPRRRTTRPWLNVLLFFATFLSALLSQMMFLPHGSMLDILLIPLVAPEQLLTAMPFAVTLMSILLAHEMGHYLTARRYGVDQSLPYFIPAPTIFGTLGAVILMRSQPPDRRVLLNVAVMGPYAGLVLAIPAAAWGLAHSIPYDDMALNQGGLVFGDSLLFRLLENVFSPAGTNVILHPVAMAGWVGLFVTSLNLIPAAQLDGGHVAYALFGKLQERLSLIVIVVLFTGGMMITFLGEPTGTGSKGGEMWILWSLLLFVIGIRHPPVQDETRPLSRFDKANGILALGLFVLTFIPIPVQFAGPVESGIGEQELPFSPDNPYAPGRPEFPDTPDAPDMPGSPESPDDGHGPNSPRTLPWRRGGQPAEEFKL